MQISVDIVEFMMLVESTIELALGLGRRVIAEGIETAAEAEACRDLGFHLAQGYHFGKPMTVENAVLTAETQKSLRAVQ